ncbi:unnamed protein product [Amoebophrya sp. A25]|nr:unnamed protein product [Amoebophrya sp. A25]|eukprot:GSA25T00001633001.1
MSSSTSSSKLRVNEGGTFYVDDGETSVLPNGYDLPVKECGCDGVAMCDVKGNCRLPSTNKDAKSLVPSMDHSVVPAGFFTRSLVGPVSRAVIDISDETQQGLASSSIGSGAAGEHMKLIKKQRKNRNKFFRTVKALQHEHELWTKDPRSADYDANGGKSKGEDDASFRSRATIGVHREAPSLKDSEQSTSASATKGKFLKEKLKKKDTTRRSNKKSNRLETKKTSVPEKKETKEVSTGNKDSSSKADLRKIKLVRVPLLHSKLIGPDNFFGPLQDGGYRFDLAGRKQTPIDEDLVKHQLMKIFHAWSNGGDASFPLAPVADSSMTQLVVVGRGPSKVFDGSSPARKSSVHNKAARHTPPGDLFRLRDKKNNRGPKAIVRSVPEEPLLKKQFSPGAIRGENFVVFNYDLAMDTDGGAAVRFSRRGNKRAGRTSSTNTIKKDRPPGSLTGAGTSRRRKSRGRGREYPQSMSTPVLSSGSSVGLEHLYNRGGSAGFDVLDTYMPSGSTASLFGGLGKAGQMDGSLGSPNEGGLPFVLVVILLAAVFRLYFPFFKRHHHTPHGSNVHHDASVMQNSNANGSGGPKNMSKKKKPGSPQFALKFSNDAAHLNQDGQEHKFFSSTTKNTGNNASSTYFNIKDHNPFDVQEISGSGPSSTAPSSSLSRPASGISTLTTPPGSPRGGDGVNNAEEGNGDGDEPASGASGNRKKRNRNRNKKNAALTPTSSTGSTKELSNPTTSEEQFEDGFALAKNNNNALLNSPKNSPSKEQEGVAGVQGPRARQVQQQALQKQRPQQQVKNDEVVDAELDDIRDAFTAGLKMLNSKKK